MHRKLIKHLIITLTVIINNLVPSIAEPEKLGNLSGLSLHLYKKEIKICILMVLS